MSGQTWQLLEGDVIERLADLPDESIQCVVTSPPYWGLRDYGVEGAGGLEATLQEHLDWIVRVFREVRRVLRSDGTLWLNYGDAYAGSYGNQGRKKEGTQRERSGRSIQSFGDGHWQHDDTCDLDEDCTCNPSWVGGKYASGGTRTGALDKHGLAAKQRLMLPARVALALQADGWWIRSEIVWAKGVSFCPSYSGSCMPSSVWDRPTDSHEMVYLLTKQGRYFYDADAVREDKDKPTRRDGSTNFGGTRAFESGDGIGFGRNLRTVWTINPKGYAEAHFATFPPALVKPCLMAGTSEKGACSECGAPWRRVVERVGGPQGSHVPHSRENPQGRPDTAQKVYGSDLSNRYREHGYAKRETTGWEPTCAHADAPTRPCMVLDPFNGSGTTGAVAVENGLSYVGIELNPEYLKLARKRIGKASPGLWCRQVS